MKRYVGKIKHGLALVLAFSPGLALAFNSGSTGADGAFSPTVNTELQLPPSGVFNFTSVDIPTGVTVTFKKNATNTPVVILASGNVTIAGTLNVSGSASAPVGAAGDGNQGDDGQPGVGGPGGYDGGRGGLVGTTRRGGNGLGPGGGSGGDIPTSGNCAPSGSTIYLLGGGGGGFGAAGANSSCGTSPPAAGGPSYGAAQLLPLIAGSGGGGGTGGSAFEGSGGGGGGGALLIAASGTVTVTGSILANGGASGAAAGQGVGMTGGGGSGGAIRIVATAIAGNGTISGAGGVAAAAPTGQSPVIPIAGGNGAVGRIRLEAETFTRTAATTPPFTSDAPGALFVAGFPTLAITSVAGVPAPAAPTGNADITLPASTPNPVTVVFNTTGVPVGNTVKLTVTPAYGAPVTVVSPALTGTTASATASVSVNLPTGPSVLSATTTYTIVVALGEALSRFAQGERVEKITLAATFGGPSKVILVTVSGKEYEVAPAALAAMGG